MMTGIHLKLLNEYNGQVWHMYCELRCTHNSYHFTSFSTYDITLPQEPPPTAPISRISLVYFLLTKSRTKQNKNI